MWICLMIGCILVIYWLMIVIGKHSVSFSNTLGMMGIFFMIASSLEMIGWVKYPLILKAFLGMVGLHLCYVLSRIYQFSKVCQMIQPDLIFVFGAGLIENRLSLSLKIRLNKALSLYQQYPHTPIIVSGGQGNNEWLSEAEAMKDYLMSQGVDQEDLWMEDKSTTTYENLVFAMNLYPLKNQTIAFVSNQFHGYRIEKMVKKLGLKGFFVPANLKHIGVFSFYIREYFALFKAKIMREI